MKREHAERGSRRLKGTAIGTSGRKPAGGNEIAAMSRLLRTRFDPVSGSCRKRVAIVADKLGFVRTGDCTLGPKVTWNHFLLSPPVVVVPVSRCHLVTFLHATYCSFSLAPLRKSTKGMGLVTQVSPGK